MKVAFEKDELWIRIKNHIIGAEGVEYGFLNRLALENRWSKAFSLEAMEEYKKFIYLLCRCNHPVTPSVEVDQVWHLHLLYTKDYWDEFVPKLTKVPHHGPTEGGHQEARKFKEYYENTLISYRKFFDKVPPPKIWPKSAVRFQPNYQIKLFDSRKFIVVRKVEFITFIALTFVYLIFHVMN